MQLRVSAKPNVINCIHQSHRPTSAACGKGSSIRPARLGGGGDLDVTNSITDRQTLRLLAPPSSTWSRAHFLVPSFPSIPFSSLATLFSSFILFTRGHSCIYAAWISSHLEFATKLRIQENDNAALRLCGILQERRHLQSTSIQTTDTGTMPSWRPICPA